MNNSFVLILGSQMDMIYPYDIIDQILRVTVKYTIITVVPFD